MFISKSVVSYYQLILRVSCAIVNYVFIRRILFLSTRYYCIRCRLTNRRKTSQATVGAFLAARTDPCKSGYIELVVEVSRIANVYLSKNNKFHGVQASLLFLTANFHKN